VSTRKGSKRVIQALPDEIASMQLPVQNANNVSNVISTEDKSPVFKPESASESIVSQDFPDIMKIDGRLCRKVPGTRVYVTI
jgi:hypothetical protein